MLGSDYLLTEVSEHVGWEILKEDTSIGNKKTLKVKGKFQCAEEVNHNKRLYPKHILEREIDKLQESIKLRRLTGELDHPDILETKLKNASHLIVDLYMEGRDVIGVLEVLSTNSGKDLQALYESKVDVGVSSRGAGRVIEKEGYYEISSDFNLKTFDVVSDPSTRNAYPKLLSESQIIRPSTPYLPKNKGLNEYYNKILSGLG
jgi:hypothetical protein